MRNTTEKLNTEETIKNISNLLGIELEEIPQDNNRIYVDNII